jgi:hypothetical protein
MSKMGYVKLTTIPTWTREEVRLKKKKWADWRPEVTKLGELISCTSDAAVVVKITVEVDGEVVLRV